MEMHNVIRAEHRMDRAQQSMADGLQMFGSNRWQAQYSHLVMMAHCWREVRSAIDGHSMAFRNETFADLLIVRFNSAVFRDHPSPANKSDAHRAGCLLAERFGPKQFRPFRFRFHQTLRH